MNLRSGLMVGVGLLGLVYVLYAVLVLIPRTWRMYDLMNATYQPTGYYIILAIVGLISIGLIWRGWNKNRRI